MAAEERKKRKIVDDLSILLGEELTAGHITRLAMGLDGLQLEKQGRSDAGHAVKEVSENEPYGRTWVLQVRGATRELDSFLGMATISLEESSTWHVRCVVAWLLVTSTITTTAGDKFDRPLGKQLGEMSEASDRATRTDWDWSDDPH